MGLKNIQNAGLSPIYVGGKMIAPGDNRDIDERELPPERRAAAVAAPEEPDATPEQVMQSLRAQSVDSIKGQLAELTPVQLALLNDLEVADDKPRKTLLMALGDELIARADAALQGENP